MRFYSPIPSDKLFVTHSMIHLIGLKPVVIFLHLFVILFIGRGFCLNACWDTTAPRWTIHPPGSRPPGADTPPGADIPPDHTPPGADIPLEQTSPPDQAPPPPGADTPPPGSRLQHTVYERPVRILLERILVRFIFWEFCSMRDTKDYFIRGGISPIPGQI